MVARAPSSRVTASRRLSFLSLTLLVLGACSKQDNAAAGGADSATNAAASRAPAASACPGDNGGLTLPAGFCATVFADSIAHGRHVAVASNGDVFVQLGELLFGRGGELLEIQRRHLAAGVQRRALVQ